MALTFRQSRLEEMRGITEQLKIELNTYSKEDIELTISWLNNLTEICKQKLEENVGEQDPSVHTEPS